MNGFLKKTVTVLQGIRAPLIPGMGEVTIERGHGEQTGVTGTGK